MMHPATELRCVSPEIGLGVFATQFLPKGTVTYVHDPLEMTLSPEDLWLSNPLYLPIVERYAHTAADGSRTISWDIARYVNHCCQANTLTTAYDFEIAVRDILPGEEITDEYGLFEFRKEMELSCPKNGCRGCQRPTDILRYADQWDSQIKNALAHLQTVAQPLLSLIHSDTRQALSAYLQTGSGYLSVSSLQAFVSGSLLPGAFGVGSDRPAASVF